MHYRGLMLRLLVVPIAAAAVVVATIAAGVVGAGTDPSAGQNPAKTTIGPGQPPPTAVLPTVPVPTAPMATAPIATVPLATAPVATVVGPTTTEPALSPESIAAAYTIFGLDAARLQCILDAMPPFEADDNVALQAVQGCGAQLMPILRGAVNVAQRSNTFLDPTSSTVALPPVAGAEALPEGDAFYVGFMLLLLPEEVECLAVGLAGATTEDDATALAILQRCEVPLGQTLQMLSFALLGELTSTATATTFPVATVSAVPPSLPGTPTTVLTIASDDPLVDQFQEMLLEQEGISLNDEQAACLLSQIQAGGVDTSDMSAMLALMEGCGIALTDLLPSETSAVRELIAAG